MKTETRSHPLRGGSRKTDRNCIPGTRGRPLRALFMLLNQSEPSPYGRQRIADHAQQSVRLIQLGLSAIGYLLAHSAVHVEEGAVPSECVESLGTLMAELSDLSALCQQRCLEPGSANATPIMLHEGGQS